MVQGRGLKYAPDKLFKRLAMWAVVYISGDYYCHTMPGGSSENQEKCTSLAEVSRGSQRRVSLRLVT